MQPWTARRELALNVRASDTEPLLRLNVEAGDRDTMQQERDALLQMISAG